MKFADPIQRNYKISRSKRAYFASDKGNTTKKKIGDAQRLSWQNHKEARSQAIKDGMKRAKERKEAAALAAAQAKSKTTTQRQHQLPARTAPTSLMYNAETHPKQYAKWSKDAT